MRKTKRSKYRVEYHKNNIEMEKFHRQVRQQRIREWFEEYKNTLVCKECGENRSPCLAFHHRDESKKSNSISRMVYQNANAIKTIEKEIKKCDVLCHNCHAMLHWREKQT